jgi:CRISPR-associated protein Csm4
MMKLYSTTITPISSFATALKGDTLFGQLCWALRYALGNDKLNTLLSCYDVTPFMVVSDGFPHGYFPKPTMPSNLLGENGDDKKINRKKVWLTMDDLSNGLYINAKTDKEIENIDHNVATIKNSINYQTFTTDDSGVFSPYSETEYVVDMRDIYIVLDETQLTFEEFATTFALFAQMGFGKNTTIGKGFFTYSDFQEVSVDRESDTYMTLSPSELNTQHFAQCYYEPFVRFGKHGASLSNKNPFKKPLLLADTAAVVRFDSNRSKHYIGQSIRGHSAHSETVHQGYAIVIPIGGFK